MTATNLTSNGPRWYVRAETVHGPFGSTRRALIVWTVYRYNGRNTDGSPKLHAGNRTRFPNRAAALRWAHREARQVYGGRR
jgi:hypothetical protein